MSGINREINPGHVTKMVSSIQKMGVIRPVVCVMTSCIENIKKLYIIDGQHLFTGCIRIGCEIPIITLYSESKEEIIEWMAALNNSSKSWCLLDYIKVWKCLDGKEDYNVLLNSFNTYDLEINIIACCYNNIQIGCSQSKIIKKGEFKILDRKKGDEILKDGSDLFSVLKGNRESRDVIKYFMTAYVKWRYSTSSYNHSKFLEFLNKNKNVFESLVNSPKETNDFLNKFK